MCKAIVIKGLAGAALAAMLFAAGCNSNGSTPRTRAAAPGTPGSAIVCEMCKTTWVQSGKLDDKGHPVPFSYTYKEAKVCPDCEQAAADYFATGKVDECKTCGTSLQVVKPEEGRKRPDVRGHGT
ncbi:MAG TPA: hypothetical protein VIL86_15630 [Tepidisphaeraceae bacterium]|jgi:ribosomal protein S27E